MTREQLQAASEHLRAAAATTGDDGLEERLYDQSNQLAELATADRGPDHGRLARHTNVLTELSDATDGEASDEVEGALSEIRAYRETVDGV